MICCLPERGLQLQAKVADFGNSRGTRGARAPMTMGLVTPGYQAPEAFPAAADQYSFPMDVWSLGCIMGELFFRKVMFETESTADLAMFGAMVARLGKPPESMQQRLARGGVNWLDVKPPWAGMRLACNLPSVCPDPARQLTLECLSWDPAKRPTAEHCSVNLPTMLQASGGRPEPLHVGQASAPAAAAELPPLLHHAAKDQCQHAEKLGQVDGGDRPLRLKRLRFQAQPDNEDAQQKQTPALAQAVADASGGRLEPPNVLQASAKPQPKAPCRAICRCTGLCNQLHKYKEACCELALLQGERKTCPGCTCVFPGCEKQKTNYTSHCYTHIYQTLPIEMRVVRAFGDAGVLDLALPCDLAVLMEAEVFLQVRRHWLIEVFAGCVKEPTAVRAMANACRNFQGSSVTGQVVLSVLHQMSGPELLSSFVCVLLLAFPCLL